MTSSRNIWNRWEITAIRYLQEKGYRILETNYTIQGGEIDIIAQDQGIYVFIEVRYRKNESYGHPLDTLTSTKRKALRRGIMYYVMKNSLDVDCIRFDFIGLMPKKDGTAGHRLWHGIGIEL